METVTTDITAGSNTSPIEVTHGLGTTPVQVFLSIRSTVYTIPLTAIVTEITSSTFDFSIQNAGTSTMTATMYVSWIVYSP